MKIRYSVLAGILLATAATQVLALGAMNCRDPWIAQAFYQLYRRMPLANSPTTEECDITHYNNGHWNNYGELVSYVRGRAGQSGVYSGNSTGQSYGNLNLGVSRQDFVATVPVYQFNSLRQRPSYGYQEVSLNGTWYVIAAGGDNIIAGNGRNLVSTNGGNLVSTNGGNVIAAGGGNVVGQGGASVIAAGGGNVIAAGGGNVIAQGGGNITLYKAKY